MVIDRPRTIEGIVEAQLSTPTVTFQIQRYARSGSLDGYYRGDRHILWMPLSASIPSVQYLIEPENDAADFRNLGRLSFYPAHTRLFNRSRSGSHRWVTCSFDTDYFDSVSGFNGEWDKRIFEYCGDIKGTAIDQWLMYLAKEAMEPGFASQTLMESFGVSIAIELGRYFERLQKISGASKLAAWQLKRIFDYVANTHGPAPTIGTLAKLVGLSERHLTRAFKQTTGQTIHKYAEGVRLDEARKLLSRNDLSIKDIAKQLGFSNSSSFAAAFRKTAGMAPTDFRREGLTLEAAE